MCETSKKISKKRSKSEWETIVNECINSGMNHKDWCEKHDISYRSFTDYRRMFAPPINKKHDKRDKPKPTLLPYQRNYYITTAMELCYPRSIIQDLRKAKSEIECENILCRARKRLK